VSNVVEVAPDVFFASGTAVNWVILRDGTDLTLIDGGWANEVGQVEESIRAVGRRPEDVRAILLTHAHVDHIGALNSFHERYGTPLFMDVNEVHHAHREYLEQAGPLAIAPHLWRPEVAVWTLRVARAGALKRITLPHAQPFDREGALDLPGGPVPIATHGHTSGHSAYFIPGAGAVATGDGLITAHAISRFDGPQVLGGTFDHDPAAAIEALTPLEDLDASIVLPGHGPVHRGPIAAAVAAARERAPR
jgi:glyoxylase-like metal-dependent hydrolase (beta-lactamase superfamily II)